MPETTKATPTKRAGVRRASTKETRPRRQEMVDAAVRIFAEKGYEATSTQDLAEALGILKGSIYYYIDSKEDLLMTVVESMHEEMQQNLERARERAGNVEERLRSFIDDCAWLNLKKPVHGAVFQRDFRFVSKKHQRTIIERRDEYEQYLRDLLTEGQQSGEVRKDLDVKLMATGILTMVNGIPTWYRKSGKFSAADIASTFSELLLQGVLTA